MSAVVPGSWKPGDKVQRRALQQDGRTHYQLPPGGIIERVELHPQVEPLWNTDAGAPYRLAADLIAADGSKVPLDVVLIWREVVRGQ